MQNGSAGWGGVEKMCHQFDPCSVWWGKNEYFFVVVGAVRINERWSVVVGILVKSRYSCISPCHVRLFAEMGSN